MTRAWYSLSVQHCLHPAHSVGLMVPVQRSELVTQDMDVLADLVRQLYFDHTASFRCPDPAAVDARMHAATVSGLNASLARYGGFSYTAEVEPANPPMAVVCVRPASGLTVKAVACRWGWVSHSRFSVAYQQRFGVLPSRTLRS